MTAGIRGIMRVVAACLGERSSSVAAAYRSDRVLARHVDVECSSRGESIRPEVSSARDVQRGCADVHDRSGPVKVLGDNTALNRLALEQAHRGRVNCVMPGARRPKSP